MIAVGGDGGPGDENDIGMNERDQGHMLFLVSPFCMGFFFGGLRTKSSNTLLRDPVRQAAGNVSVPVSYKMWDSF